MKLLKLKKKYVIYIGFHTFLVYIESWELLLFQNREIENYFCDFLSWKPEHPACVNLHSSEVEFNICFFLLLSLYFLPLFPY